jgi:hypothetical protein
MIDSNTPSTPENVLSSPDQPPAGTAARWDDGDHNDMADRSQGNELTPELTNAELVQLRLRVIALENMLVALLSDVSEGQLAKVRAMAGHITPRPGQTPHPLTTGAAAQMLSLLHRAEHWDRDAGEDAQPG